MDRDAFLHLRPEHGLYAGAVYWHPAIARGGVPLFPALGKRAGG